MTRRAIVAGAGLAGLTAAWRLQEAGFEVVVLEARAAPGGRMSTARCGPVQYNTGARLIYPFKGELHALIRELGLGDALMPVRGLHAMCRTAAGQHRIDLLPGPRMLFTPGLGARDRLRMVCSALGLLRLRRSTDPDDARSAPPCDDQSLAAFVDHTAGAQALRLLVEPVFRGTRGWNPEEVDPTFYLSTTPHLIGARVVYGMRGGIGRLTAELASRLDVRYGARATSLQRQPGGCRVTWEQGSTEQAMEADLAVCATEGAVAASLVADPMPEEESLLRAVRYNSLGIVHYALDGDLPPALEFAHRDLTTRIATWQQIPAQPRTPAILYCQLTPEATREAVACGLTGRLDDLLREEVRSRVPGFDARVVHVANQWIQSMLPVFYPGYLQRAACFLDWQQRDRKTVYYCGDYLAQALLGGACLSGARAAAMARAHWGL